MFNVVDIRGNCETGKKNEKKFEFLHSLQLANIPCALIILKL